MKENYPETFAQFFEQLRQRNHLTLREFCKQAGADPANISRMERGVIPPPKSREILERYSTVLGVQQNSDDWYVFFDLAAVAQGTVPQDILNDTELVKALPLFFRTLRGQKPTQDEMLKIADKLRKSDRRG